MNEIDNNDRKERDASLRSGSTMHPETGFLATGGEMRALIRAHDWSSTLGAPATWSQSLRTAVGLMLTANHPICLFWGPDSITLYNDAFARSIGPQRHPQALGKPGREISQVIWDIIHPQLDAVMKGQGASLREDHRLPSMRHGALEETYWTYSYSPVDDDTAPNGIGGILVICIETTQQVVIRQHQAFRLQLEAALRELRSPGDILAESTRMLGEFLHATRCGYAETQGGNQVLHVRCDWTNGKVLGLAGRLHLSEFGPAFVARHGGGQPVSVEDPLPDPQTPSLEGFLTSHGKAQSGIAMPIVKHDQLVATLYAYHEAGHRWTLQQEALLRDVAERTFDALEHARAAAERDRAMLALRDSEARYRSLVEASAAIVWEMPASGEFDAPQPGWSAYTGQSFEELKGLGWMSAVHPQDQDLVAESLGQAYETRSNYQLQYRLRRHDGAYRPMLVRAVTVMNPDGSLRGWIGIHTDLAELTALYQPQRARDSQRDAGADDDPQVVWTATPEGAVQRVSDRWREWTGIRGPIDSFEAALHPDERELVLVAWQRAVANGTNYDMEHRVRHAGGDFRWVHSRAHPLRDATGRIAQWSGTIEDIHEWLVDHDIQVERESPTGPVQVFTPKHSQS